MQEKDFLQKKKLIFYIKSKNNVNDFLFFKIALNTGARFSTILNIHKKDIDFTHNFLTLKRF